MEPQRAGASPREGPPLASASPLARSFRKLRPEYREKRLMPQVAVLRPEPLTRFGTGFAADIGKTVPITMKTTENSAAAPSAAATATPDSKTKHRVSIDLLNEAIGKEIATTLQYLYFHAHFEDARYAYLSQILRRIAIAEMRHIEEFSDRVLFLEGDVDMNPSFHTRQIVDPKEMLRFAVQLEQHTIDTYNEASRIASEHRDAVTHKLFQDTIAEEEAHLDTFRTELDNLERYGDDYLALQSDAGSKQAMRELGRSIEGFERSK